MEIGVSDPQRCPTGACSSASCATCRRSRRIQRQLAEDVARLQRYHDESEREQNWP